MKRILAWWYRFSLPTYDADQAPIQRERLRYARLTAAFLLLLFVTFLLVAPIMILDSPRNPSSPTIALAMLALLIIAWVTGRAGRQIISASCVVGYIFLSVIGPLVTNPLDPTLLPLFNTLVIAIILAAALMPPIAALIAGAASSAAIVLIGLFQPHTQSYQTMLDTQLYTVAVILPVAIQMVVAVIVYVIMRNLVQTIRRADRAEEIANLQQELMKQGQARESEQGQLAEGIEVIAQVHARIANGDLEARVPLNADNVLWQVAIPLNNLLNRLQTSKEKADQFDRLNAAINQTLQRLQLARRTGTPPQITPTGTSLDYLLLEYNMRSSTGILKISYEKGRKEHETS